MRTEERTYKKEPRLPRMKLIKKRDKYKHLIDLNSYLNDEDSDLMSEGFHYMSSKRTPDFE